MNTQPNWELLAAYLAGEISEPQTRQIQQWLAQSPDNEQLLQQLRQAWQAKIPQAIRDIDTDAAFDRLDVRINTASRPETIMREIPKPAYRLWWAAAASVALLLGVFGYFRWTSSLQPEWLTKTTAKHEKILLTLGDNTKIWLNENSTLRYPTTFSGDIRQVELEGEAFFEVAKNPAKPFIISAGALAVKVLGTAFNLRTDVQKQEFETVVVEGKVAFSVKEKGEVTLTANQAGRLRQGDAQVVRSVVNPDEYMGWRTGRLIFEDTPMGEVIVQLENWYKVEIKVENPTILNKKPTGTFDNIALKRALDRLSELLSVRYEQQSENVFVIR